MFNYQAINKTPTINQIKAIIKYMEDDTKNTYDFGCMMEMDRTDFNIIHIDLNNAHYGKTYKVTFDNNEIIEFKHTSDWIS